MISLETSVPFVREVFAIIDQGKSHDGAVDVLIAAELAHGVRIIRDEACGSLAISLAPRDPRERLTMRQFLELMAHVPKRGMPEDWEAFRILREAHYRPAADDATSDRALFAFLTETSLVLGGLEFADDHWIEEPGGVISSWTQRAWGGTLAEWARTTSLTPWNQTAWDYVEFCFYLYTLVERYDEWAATAREVIRRKCERQLDEERG